MIFKHRGPFWLTTASALLLMFLGWRWLMWNPLEEMRLQFERPVVIAHRGGKGLNPENTMLAFQHSVSLGVDVLECDLWPTADGIWVIHHDAVVDRTSNGMGRVDQMSFGELEALDFAYRFDPQDNGSFPLRDKGIGIVTLEELLTRFPRMPKSIEVKGSRANALGSLVDLLRRLDQLDRCILSSFDGETVNRLRKLDGLLMTSPSRKETKFHLLSSRIGLGWICQPRGPIYQLPVRHEGWEIVTEQFVRAIHRNGQQIWVWTIDDESEMRRLLKLGVDGLITNHPDSAIRIRDQLYPERFPT